MSTAARHYDWPSWVKTCLWTNPVRLGRGLFDTMKAPELNKKHHFPGKGTGPAVSVILYLLVIETDNKTVSTVRPHFCKNIGVKMSEKIF